MTSKINRKTIAKDTLSIIEKGYYETRNGKESIAKEQQAALNGSELIRPEWQGEKRTEARFETEITVVNCTSLEACNTLANENPMCLNFASAKNPGGGFLGGASAQEESLARSSGLYPTLTAHPEYYAKNKAHKSCIYLDYMIYSPKVPVFKNDAGDLLDEPQLVSFITAPAVNAGIVKSRRSNSEKEIKEVMERRIQRVLQLSYEKGHKNLVLGAWGCGVFQNDPNMVAKLFAKALREGGIYHNVFKKVVFAVLDRAENTKRFHAFQHHLLGPAEQETFTFFWKTASPFSNWHPATFELDGHQFNCSEQYMMYRKALLFNDQNTANQILKSDAPGNQKALGRKVKNFDTEVWEAHCRQIVYDGCKAKFLQNDNLLKHLLGTKGTTLVEASPVDPVWGIGLPENNPKAYSRSTWRGKNWLGEVLTQLRDDLLEEYGGSRPS